jgi:hypothetical protein
MKAYSEIVTLQTQMEPTDRSLLWRHSCILQTVRYSADTVVTYRQFVTTSHNCSLQTVRYSAATIVAYRQFVTLQTQS